MDPPGERLTFGLLGPLQCHRNGELVDLGVYKQRALLAVLLINANEVVSTDRLMDELWTAEEGRNRQNSLWVNISRLRGSLEPERKKRSGGTVLLTRTPGYVLQVDAEAVDASRFETLALAGRALIDTDPEAASRRLSDALAMWRGHALEEFTYESFAHAEVARLEELRLATVEDRVLADLQAGRSRELISELEGLVRQHPLRERLTTQLMLALHRAGRQADALSTYGRFERMLGEELGLEPSPEAAQLEERILLGDPTLDQPAHPRVAAHQPDTALSVRGYELRDRIAEYASGDRYRAYQPAVGREVAVTIVRPDLANDADFIRSFHVRAQAVAAIAHPHVAPLLDYWREPDAAFLVTPHFDRGSLRDLLESGQISTVVAVSLIDQIGGALAAAHCRGVVHGDIRPGNVVLDRALNAYLSGFTPPPGTTTRVVGDAYTAPDLARSHEVTTRSDVFSLAVLAHDLLRASAEEGQPVLDGPASRVISKALSEDPEDRHGDASAFIAELRVALGRKADAPHTDSQPSPGENPYRGLRAFDERDAEHFFGRERLVERLLARLGHTGPQGRLVALVGPSGSGKSSVIAAGVVPALRDGALPDSARWFIVTMTPGRRPFEALEAALVSMACESPGDLAEQLAVGGIAPTVRSLIPEQGAQLVIIVDQLEELFSHATEQEASQFLAALADAASDRHSPVKLVATLRADFFDRPLRHPSFGELLRLGTEAITPLTPDELERAITEPARAVGVSIEPGLVAQILEDMSGQPGALPLLQYALTELFDQRTGTTITADSYRDLGGVSAALARRAERLFETLDADARATTRDLFLRLVTLSEESGDTRRRVLTRELSDAAGTDVSELVQLFGTHRFLSFDCDPTTRSPTVEIAHEALLAEWKRLASWIDDTRSDVRAQRRLSAAAAEWRARERNDDFLFVGEQLSPYLGWLEHPPVRLTKNERVFLEGSTEATEAARRAERRRLRLLRRLVTATSLIAALALVAGTLAIAQRQRANDKAALAEQRADEADAERALADLERLRATAAAIARDDPTVAALLAVESHLADPSIQSLDALHRALTARPGFRGLLHGGPYVSAELLGDGVTLVALGPATIDVWDLRSSELRSSIAATPSTSTRIDATADGQVAAVGAGPAETVIYDLSTGSASATLEHEASTHDVSLSSDGTRLAAARSDGTVEIWDVTSAELVTTLESLEPQVRFARWSPTGDRVAVVTETAAVEYWNPSQASRIWTYRPGEPELGTAITPNSVLFGSDGALLVVDTGAVGTGNLHVIRTADGTAQGAPIPKVTATNEPPGFPLDALYWIDEDAMLLGAPEESGAKAFDLSSGEPGGFVLDEYVSRARDFAYSRELDRLVGVGAEGLELWSTDGSGPLERVVPLPEDVIGPLTANNGSILTALAADGSRLVVSGLALPAVVPVIAFDLTTDPVTSADYDPARGGLTVGYGPNTLVTGFGGIQLLDATDTPLGPPVPFPFDLTDTAASPDGRFFAVGRTGGFVDLYTAAGNLVASLKVPGSSDGAFTGPTFSSDGELVAGSVVGDGDVGVWSTATLEPLDLEIGSDWIDARLTGRWLVATRADSSLLLVDPRASEPFGEPLLSPPGRVTYHVIDEANGRLAAPGGDSVKIWDLATGLPLGRELPYQPLRIEYSADGHLLSVPGSDHISLWNYDTDTWAELACQLAGRNLTTSEWDQFGPQTIPRRATCPQYPLP